MTMIFLGILFLLFAVFSLTGCAAFLPRQYRDAKYRKQLQKGEVLPYVILAIGFTVMGIGERFLGWEDKHPTLFCGILILIGVIGCVMITANRLKFRDDP